MRLRCSSRRREADVSDDPFLLGGQTFESRLLLGTGGVPSMEVLERALRASGSEIVTVALRRVDPQGSGSLLDVLEAAGVRLRPTRPGGSTAGDALLTAQRARGRSAPTGSSSR